MKDNKGKTTLTTAQEKNDKNITGKVAYFNSQFNGLKHTTLNLRR